MTTKEAKKAFFQARHELEQLEADLPNFEALLADNEAELAKLRREKADLKAQAEGQGRVSMARELLEQHHSDIGSQRAEVARLEADYRAAVRRERVRELRRELAAQNEEYSQLLKEANLALIPLIDKLLTVAETVSANAAELKKLGEKGEKFSPVVPEPYGGAVRGIVSRILLQRNEERVRAWRQARSKRIAKFDRLEAQG
jgi:hypothetical protein